MEDRKYLKLAIKQAKKSALKRRFPAGAILVREGKILSSQISSPFPNLFHADSKAVSCAYKKFGPLTGATLYVGMESCLMCYGVAYWAGVKRIVFGCRKTEEMVSKGYYEGENDIYAINEKNNRRIELVFIPDFEEEILGIIKEWEERL